MHDIRRIREAPEAFDAAMARRGVAAIGGTIVGIDARRRDAIAGEEAAQKRRNERAKAIGRAKGKGDEAEVARLMAEAGAGLDAAATEARIGLDAELKQVLESLPNILDAEVPEGRDETANVVLHQHGEPPRPNFAPKQHFELGEALGLMDFAAAAKLAGTRFTVLRGALARLERALGQWMLTLHSEQHGYTETAVPYLVNAATMYGTGQLPKFEDDLFKTTDGRYLIPTAEVPLTNLVREEILAESALPLRLTALSPSFRSEAGSAGRDTRGMLRQHQFQKVELVSVTRPEDSDAEHERMTACAERVLTELGLVWRRLFLCAGDTGFSAARTYDLEVWLPGQQMWREISSCSNCRDFQARRMNARYRPAEGKGTAFLHTLNGSGVAVGRALIAVLETHQQADGSVLIPEVLRPWMGGAERIS
ncbi:serine--tRNA ligase [Paeniroseomonas aquatica]|uniref:Serine--tRNA ligase n=1 Tax=Paeniroseomonas aquatica TaxID=373043 RepID=A0ABT8A6Y8_9PROT|nr:serine--tRNA ligase [Paeniroseomonas aquatica]MDN3565465.1 serine--tRNA ligase [Paeniroseomonas aquatica]